MIRLSRLVPILVLGLMASATVQAQTKMSTHAFAAKRTYAIKKALAARFQKVTGLATAAKQVRISSQTPIYVSSGPKGKRGIGLDTRTVDFNVLAPKGTYRGNGVSHTSRKDPRRTSLSFFAVNDRKRVAKPKPSAKPTTRASGSYLRSLAGRR